MILRHRKVEHNKDIQVIETKLKFQIQGFAK